MRHPRVSVVCWVTLSLILAWLRPALVLASDGYAPRVEFGARLEPGNRIIHGAGQDAVAYDEYRQGFDQNHQPLIYMTYVGLVRPVESVVAWGNRVRAELAALEPVRAVPQIGLSFTVGKDEGTGRDNLVAEGKCDAQIAALADAIASFQRPVFIRIGYEFEGGWNNYSAKNFPAAWVHVTQQLRARGLPFATVWCSAGGSAGWKLLPKLMEYYPGDEWVDWWGVDIFSENEFTKPQLDGLLDAARAHRKPVMIGEMTPRHVGVLDGEKSWDRWFAPMIDLMKRRSEIKATAYINWEWKEWSDRLGFRWHNWGDARIQRNPIVQARWVRAMTDPIYLHGNRDGTIPLPVEAR